MSWCPQCNADLGEWLEQDHAESDYPIEPYVRRCPHCKHGIRVEVEARPVFYVDNNHDACPLDDYQGEHSFQYRTVPWIRFARRCACGAIHEDELRRVYWRIYSKPIEAGGARA